jgi:cation diffusion facilitator CzcD-associated flavoprotein CzcO
MRKLADKRVGIIGTGATAVQCVPHLSRDCRELYVFQRTPSSVDVRDNHPIDPRWFAEVATAGWQQRWLENFTANQASGAADEDLVQDGWTDIARRIRARIAQLPPEDLSPVAMIAAYEESDFEKMEEIRARAEAVVRDPDTAGKLKAWYRQLCKRPCFHDEYLGGRYLQRRRAPPERTRRDVHVHLAGAAGEAAGVPGADGLELPVGLLLRQRLQLRPGDLPAGGGHPRAPGGGVSRRSSKDWPRSAGPSPWRTCPRGRC